MENLKVGDKVLVRTMFGNLVPRRVVAFSEYGPLLCSDEEYEAARREGREPDSMGWPANHILPAQPE